MRVRTHLHKFPCEELDGWHRAMHGVHDVPQRGGVRHAEVDVVWTRQGVHLSRPVHRQHALLQHVVHLAHTLRQRDVMGV
jgi:hypothetical protein